MFKLLKLAKRVSELEDQMARLTRIVETRDMDWIEMRARVKRLLDRTEKAAKRVESEEPTSEVAEAGEENGVKISLGTQSRLSPAQNRLNQMILRSRQQ